MNTAAHATSTLTSLDWVMIALYFAVLATVAWWVVSKRKKTATDYFLAGRNLSWWIVGASIFASNIGPEHVVGLTGLYTALGGMRAVDDSDANNAETRKSWDWRDVAGSVFVLAAYFFSTSIAASAR